MNSVKVEQDTSREAIKLTYRFASFDNTYAPQTESPQRLCKCEIERRIDDQEQKQYGEHR